MYRFNTTVTSSAASATSVAGSQTPGAAGNLTLTGATVTFGSGSAQFVTIISTANISNRTFVVTGTDAYGTAVTQTLTGPNNGTTTSTIAFLTVTNVSISGAAAGALTVGNSAYAEGIMYVPNGSENPFSVSIGCISTSGTYTIQHTFDNVLAQNSGVTYSSTTPYVYTATTNKWLNHPILAATTGNNDGNYAFPVSAIRVTMSAAGAVTMYLLQSNPA